MTVEEFLKSKPPVELGYIAKKMFPNNKSAKQYLSNKLNNNDNRTFTKKDAESAMKALKELSIEIINLTIE
ncbi:hypothetical protein [Chryseobacterium taichungense]|uniref:hypothetical protein n=1 Tax=Chryseobacterium taichungense TaxID=295069 RepID=UPI0028AF74F0|nr:hypothetical protein [Chryseobacterium taichungense]